VLAVTGQDFFDSYGQAGLLVAARLANDLGRAGALERSDDEVVSILRAVLRDDPPSAAAVQPADVAGFVRLAAHLRAVFEAAGAGETDTAAALVNELLAASPAPPHLAKEAGRWRLHHHPLDAALVPMWVAICAEGLARLIGGDAADRLGVCSAPACDRVFVDGSKNASRRFCSTTCQNRVKVAAFRRRQAAGVR
jgi:predicted RNA-binding Zn ribbon-like protein